MKDPPSNQNMEITLILLVQENTKKRKHGNILLDIFFGLFIILIVV